MRNAIVIGAGFGGLAVASRLAAEGFGVTVLDRLDRPGGRGHVVTLGGHHFDQGPTIITAPHLLRELFAVHGVAMEEVAPLVELDPWYRIRFADGSHLDMRTRLEDQLAEIRRLSPTDVDGYLRYLNRAERIFRIGFEELGDRAFLSLGAMLRCLPDLLSVAAWRSVYGLARQHLRDPRLQQAFSFHPLLVGGDPTQTTCIYALIHVLERRFGVHFAMGGTGHLVQALHRLLLERGVDFRFGETVEQVLIENRAASGVRLQTGEELRADVVVSNADPSWLYRHAIAPEHRSRWTDRALNRQKSSMGLFVWHFGTNCRYEDVAHHEIILGPRYTPLLREIFRGSRLPVDQSLYLHVPTRTDRSLAPRGKETMYALAPVPHLGADIDWESAGALMRDRVLEHLERTALPGLSNHLSSEFHVTPRHFEDRMLSHLGAGFSIQPLLTQSAWFRFHNRSEDVRNLYLVGAGTQPGAGLPGVLLTAKITARLIVEDHPPKAAIQSAALAFMPKAADCSMQKHASSFSAAARVLPGSMRRDFEDLYRWFRQVDEIADGSGPLDERERLLDDIAGALERGQVPPGEAGERIGRLLTAGLPRAPLLDFLEGMRLDLGAVRIQRTSDLLRYCYQAAGAVGIAICHPMGVSDRSALPHAADLGIAMQLTNICRDVKEDLNSNRIYLPRDLVTEAHVRAAIQDGSRAARERVFGAVCVLLDLADRYYASADRGMGYLPWRARLGIVAASRAYREIGVRVRATGLTALDQRCFVTKERRFGLLLKALWQAPWMRSRSGAHEESLHREMGGMRALMPRGAALP